MARGPGEGKEARRYVQNARTTLTIQAAANAWAHGVPWAEALTIAEGAIARASGKPKALRRGGR